MTKRCSFSDKFKANKALEALHGDKTAQEIAVRRKIPPRTDGEFDAVCDAAGMLLEQPQVRDWAAASFPIVLVDEGQDLRPERLRMLVALSAAARTLIAADEFQCLDQALLPNPWLTGYRRHGMLNVIEN